MAPEEAVAPATLAAATSNSGQASRRVLAEQLELLCRQWLRVPLPVLAIAVVVAFIAWDYVSHAVVLAWGVIAVGGLFARMRLCRTLLADDRMATDPARWSRVLAAVAAANGIVSGAAAPLMLPQLPPVEQALITMVMGCWGAGAVAANGSFPAAYYAFAWPFFAQVAAAWIFSGQASLLWVMLLLLMYVALLSAFVRENGRMVVDSIELRFANEKLLEGKEQLIGLLRAAYDKADSARRRAEEANRSKSRFLASASHDLRQPLHALSLLTALLNDMTDDSRVREVGRHIGQSVQSLDRLFGALLDLSRLDAGVLKAELRELDLAELIAQLAIEVRPKAQEKGLACDLQCEPLWIRADPILLERILRNLLENAIRFTEKGRIELRARRAEGDVVLSVSDTGPGIPEGEHARVFEEFYQLRNPGRDRTQGLGLGLSIVKRLADLLGYRIELASSPGQGALFTLSLPGCIAERPGAAPEAATPAAAEVRDIKVLVIEDDAEARLAMEMTLESWGCQAWVAPSLEEARALLLGHGVPDVLVSDLRLGNGLDGIEAIKALRAQFGAMPAALLTGDIAAERLRELRASGLPVLHKPVRADALRELVHRLARGK